MDKLAARHAHQPGPPVLKALVLDAFSRSALETIQSLGRHGVEVHAASPQDCLAFRSSRTHCSWRQPPTEDTQAFLQWLRELDGKNDYSLIVPSTEYSLLALSQTSAQDALRDKANLPDQSALAAALDKWTTLSLARSCEISVPETRLLEAMPSTSPEHFPLVLKARRSIVLISGRVHRMESVLVRDARQWSTTLQLLLPHGGLLEQPRLVGHGLGIELLYHRGERVWHFCHERLHEGSGTEGIGSASWYRRAVAPPPQLLESCTTLLNRLHWHGVAMIEFLRTADGNLWLMEINPRLWGSLALAIDAGVDFPWGLLLSATRQQIPSQANYRIPYFTRAFEEDTRWLIARLRANAWGGIVEFTKLTRPLLGLESWDFFDWGDLRITFTLFARFAFKMYRSVVNKFRLKLSRRRNERTHRKNLARLVSRRKPIQRLLILCYGNICRSPFAEVMAHRQFPHVHVSSAGFHRAVGRVSPAHLQLCANFLGVDLSAHRSRSVSDEEVNSADAILLMDSTNFADFRRRFPQHTEKVLFLGMFLSPRHEIRDPYDASLEQTARVLDQIAQAIRNLGSASAVPHLIDWCRGERIERPAASNENT
jgi:protein-tyrosine-phosphatase/predicted ATP-grasp superfamily ATP-dependent carboligase